MSKEVKTIKKTESNETFENGKKNENSGKKILKTVWNFVFWIAIVSLLAIWVTDFVRTKREETPIFCVARKEHKYDDGVTKECVGLGYKVYTYNRSSLKLKSQFSPFFIKMEE